MPLSSLADRGGCPEVDAPGGGAQEPLATASQVVPTLSYVNSS